MQDTKKDTFEMVKAMNLKQIVALTQKTLWFFSKFSLNTKTYLYGDMVTTGTKIIIVAAKILGINLYVCLHFVKLEILLELAQNNCSLVRGIKR